MDEVYFRNIGIIAEGTPDPHKYKMKISLSKYFKIFSYYLILKIIGCTLNIN